MLSGAEAVNAKGVVASEAAPDRTPVMVPCTMSGKWATDVSVQRSREFEDWLAERPAPARDDEEGDETYATFMKQAPSATGRRSLAGATAQAVGSAWRGSFSAHAAPAGRVRVQALAQGTRQAQPCLEPWLDNLTAVT